MKIRISGSSVVAVAVVATLATIAASANAGTAGRWTQISKSHNGAKANLGLARGKDGTLHVLWAGPGRGAPTAIYDTAISRTGAVGKPKAVLSGWESVQRPAATAAPDGSIHAVISGQKVLSNTDPYAGLNEVVGPGAWKLGSHAFGKYELSVASNAEVGTAVLKVGQLVTVWQSAGTLLFQVGTDPSTTPKNITPQGLAESPLIAVDQATGEVVIAYRNVRDGRYYFRRVVPSVGAPQAMPQAKGYAPSIATRVGGGVYSAYSPNGSKVWLLRLGSKPKAVPVPRGTQVLTAGLATGPEGRVWVFYGNEQQTYVTRTNKRVSRFEPVQAFKSPPGTLQYFRLEGEGSAGPLDLFADITVDGKTKDGSYATHVLPKLSLAVAKRSLKNKQGRITRVRVKVRVLDAGDPVAGAKVTGLPGGTKTTNSKGSVVVTVPAGTKLAVTAKKAGYVRAKGKVSA